MTMNVVVTFFPPLVTVIVREPVAAERSIVTSAVALVALVTFNGPAAPMAAPPTAIPAPNIACDPAAKAMLEPVIVTVPLLPAFAESGVSETDGLGAGGVPLPPLQDVRKRTTSVHTHTTDSCTKRLFTAEPQLFAMFGGGVTLTAMHSLGGSCAKMKLSNAAGAIASPEFVSFENKQIWG